MLGKVNAATLNVRKWPSLKSQQIGQLSFNTVINILDRRADGWYKITYEEGYKGVAYVYGRYVKIVEEKADDVLYKGKVNTRRLNVRENPSRRGKVLGRLERHDVVEVLEKMDDWAKIVYKNGYAYIDEDYITRLDQDDEGGFLWQRKKMRDITLPPKKKIKAAGSTVEKRTITTWNKYGNLLDLLSEELGIDVAGAIAVLCVEGGGNGFGMDGRVLIRFENHLFHKWWGIDNDRLYDRHFKFKGGWQHHSFRLDRRDDWTNVHSSQETEWQAFELAKTFDEAIAYRCISMGAPQIMGFNYKRIGYKDPQEMMTYFAKDIRYHIFALFDFFSEAMIESLRDEDYRQFASYYNGRGKEHIYGPRIKEYVKAFPGKP